MLDNALRKARTILRMNGVKIKAIVTESSQVRTYCTKRPGRSSSDITLGLSLQAQSVFNEEACVRTIIHEYGHAFIFNKWHRFSPRDQRAWVRMFGGFDSSTNTAHTLEMALVTLGQYDDTRFVSWYSTTSAHEDWAECFAHALTGGAPYPKDKVRLVWRLIAKYGSL